MCGLAGIVAPKGGLSAETLRPATDCLVHRGPEEEGFWCNENRTVAFGHRRLCIIDLSEKAAQPMRRGRHTLIYNGEIYNYRELRTVLEKRGEVFQSNSDTEVLLAAYATWGQNCLQHLDGMFAFAVWDEASQTLFAARDRLGEKPFYFVEENDRFLFTSEVKAFWPLGIQRTVNEGMLYNFLSLGYTNNPTDPTETFYSGIKKLPAAHWLSYSLPHKQLQLGCYWQVYIEENKSIKEGEAIETFTSLFADSVRKRLRSDVAIGTSLSGGLDSSAVVAFCQGETATHYSHKCFTASFPGFEKDETIRAAQVAAHFNLQHVKGTILPAEVPALMDRVSQQQDEPFSSASALAQDRVFALAKEAGVTVLLDGQGADEILAGYYRFYKWQWQELYRQRRLRQSGELQAARGVGVTEGFGVGNKVAALLPHFTASLLQARRSQQVFWQANFDRDFAFRNRPNFSYVLPVYPTLNGALHHTTFVVGLEELLRMADRNSMAHSIEVRLPFLQHQLVEFLFTLPPQFKIHQGWTKWLLRKALASQLPEEIVWQRNKIGYEPPQKEWTLLPAVQERIQHSRTVLVANGILHKGVLQQPVTPKAAHDAGSFDWRYWSASHLFASSP